MNEPNAHLHANRWRIQSEVEWKQFPLDRLVKRGSESSGHSTEHCFNGQHTHTSSRVQILIHSLQIDVCRKFERKLRCFVSSRVKSD